MQPPVDNSTLAGGEPETTLIARAKLGDADAISALYERYAPQIQRYIASRLSDPVQAEDVCADVFVKVLESLSRYEDRGWPFSVWLYRIAYARTADLLCQSSHNEVAQMTILHPPKYGASLLRHLPKEVQVSVIGDLQEEFSLVLHRLGQAEANIWYYKQAVSSFWHLTLCDGQKRIKQRVLGWVNEVFRRLT